MTRYQGVRLLGAGAFGAVYLARDTYTDTAVAVKVLTEPTAIERFVREAKLLVDEAGNAHVVRILDHDFEAPAPFLVLEYCDQGSLLAWVTERRPWPEVALALAHVAAGLAPLHARGGYHRDVKPGNLLVTLDPARGLVVKVADFGLARRPVTGAGPMTNTPGGTAGYIAPEVLRAGGFDSRADVYSLGVVALELLTGNREVEGASAALAAAAPPELAALVLGMLDPDPRRRPTAARLVGALVGLAERARPPATAEGRGPAGPTFMQALFGGLAVGAAILGAAALVLAGPDDGR